MGSNPRYGEVLLSWGSDLEFIGKLIGALIIGTLNNDLNLLGVSSFFQMVVKD
ncbi:hypothetical protein QTG56_11145 [Rossellomorea sp. AcN35-11]|nr:hypothetical protein [Rossellomorea aquimaris]WJV31422.1 hypothetical protein QTG56_11145 [Rossellomorea sp. AcN35-11]